MVLDLSQGVCDCKQLWQQPALPMKALLLGLALRTRDPSPAATCIAALRFASELPGKNKEPIPTLRPWSKQETLGTVGKGPFHFTSSIKAFLKYKLNGIENVKSLLSHKKLSYSQHLKKKIIWLVGKYKFLHWRKRWSVPGKQRVSTISPFEYFLMLTNFLKRLTEVSFLQPKASESEISIFSLDSYTIYRTEEQITT